MALAGGALLLSTVLELIEPATEKTSIAWVALAVLTGAVVFSVLDRLVPRSGARTAAVGFLPRSRWTGSRRTSPSASR